METTLTEGDLIRITAADAPTGAHAAAPTGITPDHITPWGLTWGVRPDGQLAQIGLGPDGHLAPADVPMALYPLAHRTWGSGDAFREAALRVTHGDGTLTTRLRARTLKRTDEPDGAHTTVRCSDAAFDFTVEYHFLTHPDSGVLEQWVEIEHNESAPVVLHDYDSACHFLLASTTAEITQFGGSGWSDEWHWSTETLNPGIRSLASLGGVQPHLQRSPMLIISPDGPSTEDSGATLGLSICWGGNTRFHLDARPKSDNDGAMELVVKAGANPYGADYTLDPGVRFRTPTVAWIWTRGRGAMTQAFHQWSRARVLRQPDRTRPIVVNNWEATFFDFDTERITGLIRSSADLGGDVFLLDDGWFGNNFPRNNDEQGLGDWEINSTKLPGGLAALADTAERAGIRFGIWVEPEMVNPASNLYSEHPDWVIRDVHEPLEHRSQFVLDPLRGDVRDFEVGVLERTLAAAPSTSYVKWDANRPITDPGSTAIPSDRQSNLFVDGVWRTWDVMARVAEAHPDVELMLCASGGGRNDHGTLRHFHEFWTSDNTDPIDRIRMQWACLHFFPASVVAAHVTRWGGRPLGFACAVALSARFGIDLDLDSLSPSEMGTLRSAVATARRTQGMVQHGNLHRLVSPVDGVDHSRAALAFVSPAPAGAGDLQAVVFRYQIHSPSMPGSSTDGIDRRDGIDGFVGIDVQRRYEVIRTTWAETVTTAEPEVLSGSEVIASLLGWSIDQALCAEVIEIRPM